MSAEASGRVLPPAVSLTNVMSVHSDRGAGVIHPDSWDTDELLSHICHDRAAFFGHLTIRTGTGLRTDAL